MVFWKYYVVITVFVISCVDSRNLDRFKRGSMGLRQLICQRHPEKAYCKEPAETDIRQPIAQARPKARPKLRTRQEYCAAFKPQFGANCVKSSVDRNYINFCSAYANQCGVVVQVKGSTESKIKLYCGTYQPHFANCKVTPVKEEIIEFCMEYSQLCGQPFEAPPAKEPEILLHSLPLPPKFPTTAPPETTQPNVQQPQPNMQQPQTNAQQPKRKPQSPTQKRSVPRETCLRHMKQAEYYCARKTIIISLIRLCHRYFLSCYKHLSVNPNLQKAAIIFLRGARQKTGGQTAPRTDDGSGKVGVGTGLGVGEYFEGGAGVDTDWLNGQYGTHGDWNVPLAPGVNGSGGVGVAVPPDEGKTDVDIGFGVGEWIDLDLVDVDTNWEEGKYGVGSGWDVPFLPGIDGSGGVGVEVPPGEERADVDLGLGVGEFVDLDLVDVDTDWGEGKYDVGSGWDIPFLPGIDGNAGVEVGVPPDEGRADVDIGGGVGEFFDLDLLDLGVDWENGDVGLGQGVAVPFVGVGVRQSNWITFPSVNDFEKLKATQKAPEPPPVHFNDNS